jgi:hypothetical protein
MQTKDISESTPKEEEKVIVSPFAEVDAMNYTSAVNILIQAANAAQGSGSLSVRDSVLVAGAAEFLTSNSKENEKA